MGVVWRQMIERMCKVFPMQQVLICEMISKHGYSVDCAWKVCCLYLPHLNHLPQCLLLCTAKFHGYYI